MNAETLLELAARCQAYDPRVSADNRADELAIHQDIVMATGLSTLSPSFDSTFVRSLDAAMMLVPEGWNIDQIGEWYDTPLRTLGPWAAILYKRLTRMRDGGSGGAADPYARCQHAQSAALALTAAALRAHANRETNNG